MDLVDIDKVLDNFELNEAEHNNKIVNLKQLSNHATVALSVPNDTRYEKNLSTGVTTGERTSKFIGVSQVLSSLNDYCKNVKSLDASIGPYQSNEIQDNNKLGKLQNKNRQINEASSSVDFANENGDEISKFVLTDESYSITTPSPSFFSPGPSSALVSTESDKSFDDKIITNENIFHLKSQSAYKNVSENASQCSELDDLAAGLSSISLDHRENSSIFCTGPAGNIFTENHLNLQNYENQIISQESRHLFKATDNDKIDTINMAVTQSISNPIAITTCNSAMDEISYRKCNSNLQEIKMPLTFHGADKQNLTLKFSKISTKTDRKATQENNKSVSQASSIEFNKDRPNKDHEIDNCNVNDVCDKELSDYKQNIAQKRPRPTTLDLNVKKTNLCANAGQTPLGLIIHTEPSSSSEGITPEDWDCMNQNHERRYFNDDAGHTPPERSVRSVPACSTNNEFENSKVNCGGSIRIVECASIENEPSLMSLNNDRIQTLGRMPPIWVPDNEANSCMQCQHKFTLLKRRHHCRACGQVLCSVCCSQKYKLEFLLHLESRVCVRCLLVLSKNVQQIEPETPNALQTPNPNNPMEYCSTLPPHRQVDPQAMSNPTVIVPVGVLKKEGSIKKSRKRKSVMFSDGIRPGSDLATLDGKWSDTKHARKSHDLDEFNADYAGATPSSGSSKLINKNKALLFDDKNAHFIPNGEKSLPPILILNSSGKEYQEVANNTKLIKRLHQETVKFAVRPNFYVYVKISHLRCCINQTVINFTTNGLHHVGNDEIIILLELDKSNEIPKDIFVHLNEIYMEASKGFPVSELGFSTSKSIPFLSSREHGGFLFIRSSFQCLVDVHVPNSPFLIGILVHRCEVPWAKIFPLRLMLRLGAQYRYYPSPHVSVRKREPVYGEIAQTIINLLARLGAANNSIEMAVKTVHEMESNQQIPLSLKEKLQLEIGYSLKSLELFQDQVSKTPNEVEIVNISKKEMTVFKRGVLAKKLEQAFKYLMSIPPTGIEPELLFPLLHVLELK